MLEVDGIVSIFDCCLPCDNTGWVFALSSLLFQVFFPSLLVVVSFNLDRIDHNQSMEIVLVLCVVFVFVLRKGRPQPCAAP